MNELIRTLRVEAVQSPDVAEGLRFIAVIYFANRNLIFQMADRSSIKIISVVGLARKADSGISPTPPLIFTRRGSKNANFCLDFDSNRL